MQNSYNLIVIGGGAAGFFAALKAKSDHPNSKVLLIEKTGSLLSKVRVSGGGRCNVTHSCFDPKTLVQNYPRGSKELLGPFTKFQPKDTIAWFESRGVTLKTEADGRMFPVTDDSATIIDCLLNEARQLNLEIRTKQRLETIQKIHNRFQLTLTSGEILECNCLILATGSSPEGHNFAKSFGHTIQAPVPSLFTFNVPSFALVELSGIAVEPATVHLMDTKLSQTGPLLITHWGFSGPAALKLSAWGARLLHERDYKVRLSIDWIPQMSKEQVMESLKSLRQQFPGQILDNNNPFPLPKNLWKKLIELTGIDGKTRISNINNQAYSKLCERLKTDIYSVEGKTTHKEEFVTCGGVTLAEVDFKTMESKLCPGLYFAGESLDVDAVTGGFNFQNAWTTGWIAGTLSGTFKSSSLS